MPRTKTTNTDVSREKGQRSLDLPAIYFNRILPYFGLPQWNNVAFPVQPIVILLDPDSTNGGFERQWARLDAGIATHQGYAFQWFSLAAALAAIYILLNTRKTDYAENQPNQD